MLEILSIGDLVEPGTYDFLNGFRRVVNLTDGKRTVTLALPGIDRGPLNVIVRGLDPDSVEHVRVEPGAIVVGGTRVEYGEGAVYDSSLPAALRGMDSFRRNLGQFGALLLALSPRESLTYLLERSRISSIPAGFHRNLAEHTLSCVRDMILWNRRRGVSRLSGCGIGLTPSGDDFIVGFLLGLVVLQRMGFRDWDAERGKVLEWTGLRDVLSTSFLSCAARGHTFESMRELIVALDLGDAEHVRAGTERLLQVGATSGADTGVGLFITVREGLAGRLKGSHWTPANARAINESPRLWS
jgi:hypothetical protein